MPGSNGGTPYKLFPVHHLGIASFSQQSHVAYNPDLICAVVFDEGVRCCDLRLGAGTIAIPIYDFSGISRIAPLRWLV